MIPPVPAKLTVDVLLAALAVPGRVIVPPEVGGQHANRVAAATQVVDRVPPDELVASQVMGRIHVSDSENPHGASIVGSRLIVPAVLALALLVGCGFNDQLTRRGFINSGDLICAETIIKANFESAQAAARGQPRSPTEVVRSLAGGYGAAARRFATLEVSGDDKAMRDRMAAAFRATAQKLDLATRSAGGEAGVARAGITALGAQRPAARAMQAYGFTRCGSRPRPA